MMKNQRTLIRPFFTIVFVLAAAAVTLCFRVLISGAGEGPSIETVQDITHNLPTMFNASVLAFSAVDLAENSLRQNVEHLVGVDFRTEKTKHGRPFLSVGRLRSVRSVRGGPMELSSPEFYKILLKFRQYLKDWWRRYRFEPDIMSNMVNVKYKTCAVVGNSGILLKRAEGKAIDNQEFVIRLNNARVDGYERFVGSKTSLSFMNSNILHLCSRRGGCFCHPYGEKVPIMIYISQPVHFLDYTICNSSHKAPLMITDPQLDVLAARIVKYYSVKRFVEETGKPIEEWSLSHGGAEFHYSSGMQAIMFALGVCNKVSIFGFGKSDSAKHHYHTNQKTELSLHDYQAEFDLYQDLAKMPEAVPFISDKFKFPTFVIHR